MSSHESRPLIRFDWAMKRLLRDKANFAVLEGFLTTLLNREIKISRILESESNQEYEDNKYNRVDILAESTDGEKMLIEVQNQSEVAYFHRMLFGTARLISEYAKLGESYGKISKIYSINIVYFNLGQGDDSVYIGETCFKGLHNGDELRLPASWQKNLRVDSVSDIFPVYYILRVDEFDKWSRTPLDQWLYFLSKGKVGDNADAPGMDALQEKMRLDSLTPEERIAYRKKVDDQISIRDGYRDARYEGYYDGHEEGLAKGLAKGLEEGLEKGLEKGREEGLEKGREEGLAKGLAEGREEGLAEGRAEGLEAGKEQMIKTLFSNGMSLEDIATFTGYDIDTVKNICK